MSTTSYISSMLLLLSQLQECYITRTYNSMILLIYYYYYMVHLCEHILAYDFNCLASLFLFHTHLEKYQSWLNSTLFILCQHLSSKNGCRKSYNHTDQSYFNLRPLTSTVLIVLLCNSTFHQSMHSPLILDGILFNFFSQTSKQLYFCPLPSSLLLSSLRKYKQSNKIFRTPPPYTLLVSYQSE